MGAIASASADAIAAFDAARTGSVSAAQLDAIWAVLTPARPEDLLGSWSGFAFSTGHPIERVLAKSGWVGKRFDAIDDVQPLVCRGEDGVVFDDTSRGAASLWSVEFRGESTATMVYDQQPILDHFKWVDERTLMGIMNGKGVLDANGQQFYFGLERA